MNAIHAVRKRFLAAGLFFAGLALFVPNAMAALSVSITSPASNSSFTSGAAVAINASASPTNGRTVTKVQFYYGGTNLIGTDTSSPYSVSWVPPGPGTYSLTAKVTDSGNSTKTSTAVSIKVLAPPTVSLTSPANGARFQPPRPSRSPPAQPPPREPRSARSSSSTGRRCSARTPHRPIASTGPTSGPGHTRSRPGRRTTRAASRRPRRRTSPSLRPTRRPPSPSRRLHPAPCCNRGRSRSPPPPRRSMAPR